MKMDLVTTALIAAISAGAGSAGDALISNVVNDAYQKLKKTILRFYGTDNPVSVAVTGLESNPESNARKLLVEEEISSAGASTTPEITSAATALIAALDQRRAASSQHASGSFIAQASSGGKATISVKNGKPVKDA
jgi:hypothetical protein